MDHQDRAEEPRDAAEPGVEANDTPSPVPPAPTGSPPPRSEAVGRVSSVRAVRPVENGPARSGLGVLWTAIALVIVGILIGGVLLAVRSGHSAQGPVAIPTSGPIATPAVRGGSVAAVVNGHNIPTSTYRLYVNLAWRQNSNSSSGVNRAQLGRAALNQAIVIELASQYATAHHLHLSSSDLNKQIARYRAHYGGQRGFQAWLGSLGLTYPQFKLLLEGSLLEGKVVDAIAPVHPVKYAHVRHILITVPATKSKGKNPDAIAHAKAEMILKEIKAGKSFAALAKKYSQDPGSATHGGDLGTIYPGQTVAPFDRAAFSLRIGQVAIVKSQFGYHIIEVLGRGKKIPPPNSQQRQSQQGTKFTAWVDKQMKTAKIKRIATVS